MPSLVLAAGLAQGANVLREAGNRVVGLPELLGTIAGARRPKRLRIAVLILRDEAGAPVATEAELAPALAEAQRVLQAAVGIELVPARVPQVTTLAEKAPSAALDAPCAEGSFQAELGPGGAYFRSRAVRDGPATLVTGSGAPVTVFVVRNVLGRAGCSLGPLTDYVTIDRGALGARLRRVLAHELGHACGLPHTSNGQNLMFPRVPGDRLAPWQAAVFRSSRHVTYR